LLFFLYYGIDILGFPMSLMRDSVLAGGWVGRRWIGEVRLVVSVLSVVVRGGGFHQSTSLFVYTM
jgi:hypothetical protein